MPYEKSSNLDLNGPLTQEIMKRMSNEVPVRPFDLNLPKTSTQSTLDPTLATILGAVADGISTYSMMNNGGKEDNPMLSGMGGPATTGMATIGTGLAVPLLARLLKGKLPSKIVDPIVANMGARTLGTAGENFDGLNKSTSLNQVHNSITKNITGQER